MSHFRGAKKKPYMTTEQFVKFLNKEQRDPRLNEILYPYYSSSQALELILKNESKANMASKGRVNGGSLSRVYLHSSDIYVYGFLAIT